MSQILKAIIGWVAIGFLVGIGSKLGGNLADGKYNASIMSGCRWLRSKATKQVQSVEEKA